MMSRTFVVVTSSATEVDVGVAHADPKSEQGPSGTRRPFKRKPVTRLAF